MKRGGRDLPNLHFSGHEASICAKIAKGEKGDGPSRQPNPKPQNHQRIQSFPCCFTRTRRRFYPSYPSEVRLVPGRKAHTPLGLGDPFTALFGSCLSSSALFVSPGHGRYNNPGPTARTVATRILPPWTRAPRACARCACSSSSSSRSPSSRDAVCVMRCDGHLLVP